MTQADLKKNWYLWLDSNRSPFMNMACDEQLLLDAAKHAAPLIRIYGWDRPSASIGYVQDYNAAPHDKYTVVRRPTGGGIVYHDYDLTYTVAVPPEDPICKLDRMESYHVFHRAVLRAMAGFGLKGSLSHDSNPVPDRATMQCFVTPTRYDVLCDNHKYAGAAQRRTRDGILHQGSIMLDASRGDWNALKNALVAALETEFNISFIDFIPDEIFLHAASELSASKYEKKSWNISKEY